MWFCAAEVGAKRAPAGDDVERVTPERAMSVDADVVDNCVVAQLLHPLTTTTASPAVSTCCHRHIPPPSPQPPAAALQVATAVSRIGFPNPVSRD